MAKTKARPKTPERKGYRLTQLYCSRDDCKNMAWWAMWHALPPGWFSDPVGRPYCSMRCYMKSLEGKIGGMR